MYTMYSYRNRISITISTYYYRYAPILLLNLGFLSSID